MQPYQQTVAEQRVSMDVYSGNYPSLTGSARSRTMICYHAAASAACSCGRSATIMLVCSGCDQGFHMHCMGMGGKRPPPGFETPEAFMFHCFNLCINVYILYIYLPAAPRPCTVVCSAESRRAETLPASRHDGMQDCPG